MPPSTETIEKRNERMDWWFKARFGMFLHFGLYSVPAGVWNGKEIPDDGAWIMAFARIPKNEYELLAEKFNPTGFNSVEWVRQAKEAGMKYFVVTAKHHEGFCLWDSHVSDFTSTKSTPFRRDIILELQKECEKQGVKFGIYYSILDWHHNSQTINLLKKTPQGIYVTEIIENQKEVYIQYMKAQLKELIGYNPDLLWFDGEWVHWWTEEDGKDLYNYLRDLKPNLIINNRIGKGRNRFQGFNKEDGFVGDYASPEQEIPTLEWTTKMPWESCMTMNDTWGYKVHDDNWKSSELLLNNLKIILSMGGNYLLNVGPTADGIFPTQSKKILEEIKEAVKTLDFEENKFQQKK